jgi:succinate dehydrogenase/fumarate reductase flavoprotein subunit
MHRIKTLLAVAAFASALTVRAETIRIAIGTQDTTINTATGGLPPLQVEYKLRRLVNDYLQPPKVTRKMEIALERFAEIGEDLDQLQARDPHELMRAAEVSVIRDCAEMAARASLFRTESRWGLYHLRVDHPQRDDAQWFCHTHLTKGADGEMRHAKRPVEPYIVPIDDGERDAYGRLRVRQPAEPAIAPMSLKEPTP